MFGGVVRSLLALLLVLQRAHALWLLISNCCSLQLDSELELGALLQTEPPSDWTLNKSDSQRLGTDCSPRDRQVRRDIYQRSVVTGQRSRLLQCGGGCLIGLHLWYPALSCA